ncbi:MAG: hypothetical protein WCZ65_06960 [Lysobacteraceae bacterium]
MIGLIGGLLLAVTECAAEPLALTPVPLAQFERRGKPQWLDFPQQAGCLRWSDGDTALAVLVDLGALSIPAQINIEVQSSQDAVLAPDVLVLDDRGGFVAHHRFDAFSARGAVHRLTLFANPSDAVPRYLLLQPDPQWLSRTDQRVRGQTFTAVGVIGPAVVAFNHGVEKQTQVSYGANGSFRVQWTPYQARPLNPPKR